MGYKSKILVVAPHPDDEILGVGGTLLRRKFEGCEIAWLVVTSLKGTGIVNGDSIALRAAELKEVAKAFNFDNVFELNFPATKLDQVAMADLISEISKVFKAFNPEEVFIPHFSDIHTDHRVVFDAAASCVKWFRYPSIKRVLSYETLSETEFGLGSNKPFSPNVYINIEPYLEAKISAMHIYASELGKFPFPRSDEAIRALAILRGATAGFKAAEAFELLREIS